MDTKEKIAKALYEHENNPPEHVWGSVSALTRCTYMEETEAILPIIEEQQQNLQIDLQMANDTISDYKGEIAELKAKAEEQVKAEIIKYEELLREYNPELHVVEDI